MKETYERFLITADVNLNHETLRIECKESKEYLKKKKIVVFLKTQLLKYTYVYSMRCTNSLIKLSSLSITYS